MRRFSSIVSPGVLGDEAAFSSHSLSSENGSAFLMDVNGKEASIRVQYVTILCKKSLQTIQCMSDLSE